VTAIKNGADPNATLQFRRKRGKTDARGTMDVVYEIEGVCTVAFAPAWARHSRETEHGKLHWGLQYGLVKSTEVNSGSQSVTCRGMSPEGAIHTHSIKTFATCEASPPTIYLKKTGPTTYRSLAGSAPLFFGWFSHHFQR
jgi:hypothetical protein